MTEEVMATAILSEDGVYRYRLARYWADPPFCLWVMLNPSTADASQDDPTIRRCVGFAKAWGFGGIRVVNQYALRATNPHELFGHSDPIGPDNEAHIRRELASVINGAVVAGWGAGGPRTIPCLDIPALCSEYGRTLECLGVTNSGKPRHPLYIKGDQERIPYG